MVYLHPTHELVAVGWLKGVTGIGSNVATQLPADNTTWAASGFTVVSSLSGSSGMYVAMRAPVVSLDFWAVSLNSTKAPFNKANQLGEHVYHACLDHPTVPRVLSNLPPEYQYAHVRSAWLVSDIRRIRGDVADFAHYQADMAILWTEKAR